MDEITPETLPKFRKGCRKKSYEQKRSVHVQMNISPLEKVQLQKNMEKADMSMTDIFVARCCRDEPENDNPPCFHPTIQALTPPLPAFTPKFGN